MSHSSTTDLRVSVPFNVFCIATLFGTFWMAFADSLNPQDLDDTAKKPAPEKQDPISSPASSPDKAQTKPHGPKDSLVSDGLEDDVYWDDEIA